MADLYRLSVRDPVHGFIRADALETALIESRPMQRLRNVRQLGLTNLVFPGAEHSRFAHALGVMHLAGRLYDSLARADGPLDPDLRSRQRRTLRAAALLHDIGHAPFSHTAEDLFDRPIDHEEMTRRLLLESDLSSIFEAHGDGISPEEVQLLLEGTGSDPDQQVLSRVISGELDVDKMDYLMRDSLFCGVHYGTFDLERILDTVVPIEDPEDGRWGIGLEEGGLHAAEALVLARYYMFTQVYFNVTGKVLELHLNAWLREEGIQWHSDPEEFLDQDDVWVLSRMRRSSSRHADALLRRRRYVLAHETREHLRSEEKERFVARLEPLAASHGSRMLVSNSAKDPHRLGRSRVMVRRSNGHLEPMEEASDFIRHLSRIDCYRVYCEPELRSELASALAV